MRLRSSALTRSFTIKFILVVGIFILSLLFLIPSLIKLPPWWPNFFSEKIRLGLDLQGGMHLVLEVDTEKALESHVERGCQELLCKIREGEIKFFCSNPEVVNNRFINLKILLDVNRKNIEELIEKKMPDFVIKEIKDISDTQGLMIMMLREEVIRHMREQVINQALETIRNRIDQFGVSEPEIVAQSNGRILIQLPGIKHTQRAISIIGKTAQLEFKLVDDTVDFRLLNSEKLPIGSELSYIYSRERTTGRRTKEPIIIRSRASMTGETIADAKMHIDSHNGDSFVSIIFNEIGKRQFADLTSHNVKKRLAIILDGKVQSAPIIQEPILGGEARISGDFTIEEARDLAVVLRSGALPAPVKILEERTVGPSLGRDSIGQGLFAALVGGLSVFIFMLFYNFIY